MSGAYIAAIVAASQKRIVRQLREAGALSPDKAVPFAAERRIDSRQLGHLVRHGVVREASPSFYWLDEAAWARLRRFRVNLVIGIVAVFLAFLIVLFWVQHAHGGF